MKKVWSIIGHILLIVVGAFIVGIGLNLFFVPFHLMGGGVSAISILVNAVSGINISGFMIAVNVPIFIAGYFLIDRSFFLYSLIGMFTMSWAIEVTSFVTLPIEDLWASVIAGGVVTGIGGGILFRQNSSGGGFDIVYRIVYQYFSISMGTASVVINAVILCIASLYLEIETIIASIASIFICGQVINYIVEGLDKKESIMIVSDEGEQIMRVLIEELGKGVTMIDGRGGYTKEEKQIIWCIISPYQLPKLRAAVLEIDPGAFVTVTAAGTVIGGRLKAVGARQNRIAQGKR